MEKELEKLREEVAALRREIALLRAERAPAVPLPQPVQIEPWTWPRSGPYFPGGPWPATSSGAAIDASKPHTWAYNGDGGSSI